MPPWTDALITVERENCNHNRGIHTWVDVPWQRWQRGGRVDWRQNFTIHLLKLLVIVRQLRYTLYQSSPPEASMKPYWKSGCCICFWFYQEVSASTCSLHNVQKGATWRKSNSMQFGSKVPPCCTKRPAIAAALSCGMVEFAQPVQLTLRQQCYTIGPQFPPLQ
jgi:hypothetical protein